MAWMSAIPVNIEDPRTQRTSLRLQCGFDLDLSSNTLRGENGEAHLTNIEAGLLTYLVQHEGEVLHPRGLLVDVWHYRDPAGASTLVRAHISNLRRKLRDVTGTADHIETIRGKGYRYHGAAS